MATRVWYRVRDLEDARSFYTDKLGFNETYYDADGKWAKLERQGMQIALAEGEPEEGGVATVDVENVKGEADRLRGLDVEVGTVVELHSEMRILDVFDPDGNRIQLVEDLGTACGVTALTEEFTGDVVRPGDPGYDEARRIWNAMFDRRPAVVARPASPDDVATAIRWAREEELLVAVRGGGHSIPGLSSVDDGIVIDVSRLRGVEVDPERRWARVGAGCLLGELDDAAQQHSLACPVGTVSHTGVAGLTLGGGLGRLQRTFGLTIDSLLAVDLVTADGRQVRASEDENPELFWGLRGAGANFGIATSFEFRLHPLEQVITYGSVIHPIARAVELGELVEELFATTSRNLWLSFDMGPGLGADTFRPPDTGMGAVARITAHHVGTEAEAERELAPLRRFNDPLADSITRRPYLEAQRMNDVPSAWGQRFYMKSAFLSSLPRSMVEASVDHVAQIEDGIDGVVSIWTCGGAISDMAEDATAFTGREGAYWASAEVLWQDEALDEESRAWGRRFVADVAGVAVTGRYVNDISEAAEDPRAIYGDAKQARLVALKREWDPDNVFRLNQNIQP